jgi:predicted nucleotidyltransferase
MIDENVKKRALCALGEFKKKYPKYETPLVVIGGSYSFGFASDTSDVDLHGIYIIPTEDYFSDVSVPDTMEMMVPEYNSQIAMHEIGKFVNLLVQPNLNMIDDLFVPYECVIESDENVYKRLKKFGEMAVSKAAYPHIQGMIIHMRKHRLTKYNEYDPKKQLYIFREIMRGIIIMRDGKIVCNMLDLKEMFDKETESMMDMLIKKKNKHEYLSQDELDVINRLEMRLEADLLNAKEFGIAPERPHDSLRKDSIRFVKDIRRKNYEQAKR